MSKLLCYLGLHKYQVNPKDGTSVFIMLKCIKCGDFTIEQNFELATPNQKGMEE